MMLNQKNVYYCNFHFKETILRTIEEHESFTGLKPIKFNWVDAPDEECCLSDEEDNDCTAPVKWKLIFD